MLKVFLVEDEFVVREGIKNNIDWSGHGYDFCGEAGDGEVAYSMIQKLKPDIVITDIKMPFMDGITLSRMIKSEFPWIEIIILTGYEDFQFAREAIKIGVSCYLLKPVNGESIMKEVDALSEKIREKKAEREAAKRYEEEMRERTELDKRDFFNTLIKGGKNTTELFAESKKLSIARSIFFWISLSSSPLNSSAVPSTVKSKNRAPFSSAILLTPSSTRSTLLEYSPISCLSDQIFRSTTL